MSSLENRCLAGSAFAHAGLLALFMAVSFIAARRAFEPGDLPPIELVSLDNVRLTDAAGAGGGTPTPPPTAPPVRPGDPPLRSAAPAVREAVPEPVRAEARPPVTPPRPERRVEVAKEPVKAQDVDRTLKGKNEREKAEPEKNARKIEVAKAIKKPSAKELQAERAAAKAAEARRAEAEARRAAAAARAAQERWSKAVGGIHSKLSENLSGETTITVPGPGGGGEAWIGYATYLKGFYEVRWRRPGALPAPVAYVGVSITVARDGRVLRAELLEKSGIRDLDASVNEVIQRYRQLEPLPRGTTDSERSFRIKFRLEGGTQ